MQLYDTLGKNVRVVCKDGSELYVYVNGYTSELDNEPDDDGNYGGAYISVQALKPTEYFDVSSEFVIFEYEIEKIEIIE